MSWPALHKWQAFHNRKVLSAEFMDGIDPLRRILFSEKVYNFVLSQALWL